MSSCCETRISCTHVLRIMHVRTFFATGHHWSMFASVRDPFSDLLWLNIFNMHPKPVARQLFSIWMCGRRSIECL